MLLERPGLEVASAPGRRLPMASVVAGATDPVAAGRCGGPQGRAFQRRHAGPRLDCGGARRPHDHRRLRRQHDLRHCRRRWRDLARSARAAPRQRGGDQSRRAGLLDRREPAADRVLCRRFRPRPRLRALLCRLERSRERRSRLSRQRLCPAAPARPDRLPEGAADQQRVPHALTGRHGPDSAGRRCARYQPTRAHGRGRHARRPRRAAQAAVPAQPPAPSRRSTAAAASRRFGWDSS